MMTLDFLKINPHEKLYSTRDEQTRGPKETQKDKKVPNSVDTLYKNQMEEDAICFRYTRDSLRSFHDMLGELKPKTQQRILSFPPRTPPMKPCLQNICCCAPSRWSTGLPRKHFSTLLFLS